MTQRFTEYGGRARGRSVWDPRRQKASITTVFVSLYNLSAISKTAIMDSKTAGAFAPAVLLIKSLLLNGDDTLHVQRKVGHAVVRVLSWLDVREGNRD